MISEFVREQKRYTQKELCHILRCSEDHALPIIRKLKEFGVLKAVKASDVQKNLADLLEEDIEVVDVEVGENKYLYVFTFVGVIVVSGRVLKCYPKYLLSAKEPTDEELDDFGDKEYILYRIENELNTQFNTRKQLVLKTMYAYIDRRGSLYDTECLSLFGTNSFNLVWEKICAEIMDNQLDVPLGILKLPVPLKEDYNRRQKLIELIEKPLWTITGKCAKDTLIPDLVSICKVNEQHQFIIFDAKYYNAHLEKGIVPTGQPGIESITKQYLYQLAYQRFIEDHKFSSVKNCFLLPTENNEIEDKGEVRMEMLSNLGLQDIKIRLIPATMAYDLYLSGSKMDMERLDL